MKRFLVPALLALLILLAMPGGYANAQEPEPTPTPAPTYTPTPGPDFARIPLSSGHSVQVDYTATFGEIAITIAILALVVVLILLAALLLPKVYL